MNEILHDAHAWVALSFVIFAVLAFVVGRPRITAKLDERIATIRKDIDTAESLRTEAEILLATYTQKQQEATREAASIIKAAQEHAALIRQQATAELNETLQRREQQLQDRLQRQQASAVQEIRAYAAELAVKATAEIIADKMDEKTNAQLVEQSVKNVAGQLA